MKHSINILFEPWVVAALALFDQQGVDCDCELATNGAGYISSRYECDSQCIGPTLVMTAGGGFHLTHLPPFQERFEARYDSLQEAVTEFVRLLNTRDRSLRRPEAIPPKIDLNEASGEYGERPQELLKTLYKRWQAASLYGYPDVAGLRTPEAFAELTKAFVQKNLDHIKTIRNRNNEAVIYNPSPALSDAFKELEEECARLRGLGGTVGLITQLCMDEQTKVAKLEDERNASIAHIKSIEGQNELYYKVLDQLIRKLPQLFVLKNTELKGDWFELNEKQLERLEFMLKQPV